VPFTAFFPAGVADPTLIHRLTAQAQLQGLLRQAVVALQAVMRRGAFYIPPSVEGATQRFREEADPVRAFIDECIREERDVFTARSDVYTRYVSWTALNGFHQMSAARFYESFVAALVNVISVKIVLRRGVRGYVNLRVM